MKLCECGCGQETLPYAKTRRDYVKGEPRRFVQGHNLRILRGAVKSRGRGPVHPSWRGDAAGYFGMHTWINKEHPKTGICSKCGRRPSGRGTEYAFLRHPEPATRNIDDYRELCTSCHRLFDAGKLEL